MSKEGMINKTEKYNFGQIPGIESTISGMEEFDMNKLNDVTGTHGELNGPKNLSGKGGSGK